RHVDLSGIGFSVSDEFWNRPGRKRRMHLHDKGLPGDTSDRDDIANKIETELTIQGRIDCVRRTNQKQRVTVCRRTYDSLGGNISACARPVLNDEWLAKVL